VEARRDTADYQVTNEWKLCLLTLPWPAEKHKYRSEPCSHFLFGTESDMVSRYQAQLLQFPISLPSPSSTIDKHAC
jgi:hypothetical protein